MSLESAWENTCRLCSEEKLEMLQIFGDEGKQRKVAQKLRVCLPVLVYKTDPLPKQICQFCAARLDDIFEFREYCLNVYRKMHFKLLSHKDLNSVNVFLDAMSNSPDPCQVQLCMVKPRAPPPLVPLPSSLPSATPNVPAIISEIDQSNVTIEPLSELPCEVQIKEEPSDVVRQEEKSPTDEQMSEKNFTIKKQDGESTESDDGDDDDDDDHSSGKEFDSTSGKKTSILEQVLTGNLTINDCQEISPKTKLTSEWWCSPCNNYYRSKEGLVKHMQLYCPRSYTCGKCSRVFKSVEELAKHEGTDHLKITLDFDESMKECHQCDREFVSWEMLRHHRMRDHIASSIELGTSTWCQICNRFFPNLDDYHSHVQLHGAKTLEDVPTVGEFTEVVPKVQEDLEDIKREHFIKSIKSLTCPTCGKVCTQQSALSNHMRTHEPKKHKCEECGRSFGLLIRLETHKLSEHNQQTILSPAMTSFEQEEALNAEREAREAREAKMKGNRCRKYSETFDEDEAMMDQPAAKRAPINPKSSKNVARCGICQQWFNDHTTMLTHLQTHSDNLISKNFSCNFCKKSFREKWQLQRHEVSHKRSKTSTKKEKDSYEKTHTVDKTYHCPKCNKIFFKEFSLITHQCSPTFPKRNSSSTKTKTKAPVSAADGKKFKCSKCPESFMTSQARASHMRVHAEPKTSKKEVVEKVDAEEMPKLMPETSPGTSIPILEPKVEIKEQDPPAPVKRTLIRTANGYRCGVCQSPFVLRELAVAHLRSAHPVMPYQCPYCKKRFTTQYTFTHHIKTDHPDESEK